jgi:hypothetical protein
MNALETILNNNNFDEISSSLIKGRKWKKDDFTFGHNDIYSYESYILSFKSKKFGFVHENFIVWEKYERCIEQLQEAIDWMEKCKNL